MNVPILSPNQKLAVRPIIVDRQFYYEIQNTETKKVVRVANDYEPLYSLNWSPDSNDLVSLAHAAETSFIVLLHWNGKLWAFTK